jgi:general secretion pathway protein H
MTWSDEDQSRAMTAIDRRKAGFTLIEVIVVFAILALALVLIVGYKPPWSSKLGTRAVAGQLASALRVARSEAIARDVPVSVTIDVATHQYRVGQEPGRRLPSALTMELLTVAGERRTAMESAIRFNPDGSSTGGRITVGDAVYKIAVGVDWLTGRVSIADVP